MIRLYYIGILFFAGCASIPEPYLQDPLVETKDVKERNIKDLSNSKVFPFDEISTFNDYLDYAFKNNAGLKALWNKWQITQELIPQIRTLNDPEISFQYFIKQHDTRYQTNIIQSFPPPGTLSLRSKYATAKSKAAFHQYETERFMIYDKVAQAVFNYYYLGKVISIFEEQLQLLINQEGVANTSYSSGNMPFSYLLNVQIEKSRIKNKLAIKKEERIAQSSTLAALLNVSGNTLFPWPNIKPSLPSHSNYDQFVSKLAELNPELKSACAKIDATYYQEKLAQKSFLPKFTVGGGTTLMAGASGEKDKWDMGLIAGISLPIWRNSYHAKVRETRASARAAENEKINLENELKAELRMAMFKNYDAESRIALYKNDLILKAEQSLQVADQEFAAGQIDFMKLINAQRTLLEFKLTYQRAIADHEIALAEIGCCIGKISHTSITSSENN